MSVLMDLDGTLTDPAEGIVACLEHALRAMNRASPGRKQLERYIGPPLQTTFGELLATEERTQIDAAIRHYRERFSTKGMFENAVYPEIPAALQALKGIGATLFVATSKPHVFAGQIVEHFGLRRYFAAVYGSELDGTRTGKDDLIAHVMKAEALTASATWMVGDRSLDVIGAKANGVRPVGALWGYGSREELASAGALLLCETPANLPGVIGA
jgi:phosphoglycolate phosphatase